MPIDGTWNLTIETPMGAQHSKLEAQTAGAVLTGVQSGAEGSGAIEDGVVDGDEASWTLKITSPMSMTLEFKGKVDGDAIAGAVKLGMFGSSTFSGVRG